MRDHKDVRVLVVDDEEALRKAIAFDFKRKGFQVSEAPNGRDAYKIIESTPVDVVLSDVRMPGGDGLELLDRIKTLNPDFPVVIFLTGFADLSVEDAYARGADAVFTKPFDRKALLAVVIKSVASKDDILGSRAKDRMETRLEVELRVPELKRVVQTQALNLGQGGFFAALAEPIPAVGTQVEFKLNLAPVLNSEISGAGTVRWIRPKSRVGLPVGCGIEFQDLENHSRIQLLDAINRIKTHTSA